jgi:hypothetical protein
LEVRYQCVGTIDREADALVAKSEKPLSHGQAVAEFLKSEQGARLYEQGLNTKFAVETERSSDTTRIKKQVTWWVIERKAQAIAKRHGITFGIVLRDEPYLYDAYVS